MFRVSWFILTREFQYKNYSDQLGFDSCYKKQKLLFYDFVIQTVVILTKNLEMQHCGIWRKRIVLHPQNSRNVNNIRENYC